MSSCSQEPPTAWHNLKKGWKINIHKGIASLLKTELMPLESNSMPVIHSWGQDNNGLGCRSVQRWTSYLILYGEVDEISVYQNLVRWPKCSIMFEKERSWYVGSESEHSQFRLVSLNPGGKEREKVIIINFHWSNFLIIHPCIKHREHFQQESMRKGEERSLNSLHGLFHFSTHIKLERQPILLSDHH